MLEAFRNTRKWRLKSSVARAAVNASWLVGDKLIRMFVGIIINVLIARSLGPASFGLLSYSQAINMMFLAVSAMGLADTNIRDFVRYPNRALEIASSALILRFLGAGIALSLAMSLAIVSRPHDTSSWLMVLILGSTYFAQSFDVIDTRLQSLGQFRQIVLIRNASFLATSGLKLGALVLHQSVYTVAVIMTLELYLTAAFFLVYSRWIGKPLLISTATITECLRQFRGSILLLARLVAVGVYMRSDQVLVGRLMGNQAVGEYAAASRISEMWYLIPMSAMMAVAPQLTRIHTVSLAAYERKLQHIITGLFYISLLAASIVSILSKDIIHLLYGEKYTQSASVLTIHIWAGVFVAIGTPVSSWFINNSQIRYGLFQAIAGSVICITLNLILIPRIGIMGAAIAVLVSQIFSSFWLNLLFPATRPVFALQLRAISFGRFPSNSFLNRIPL